MIVSIILFMSILSAITYIVIQMNKQSTQGYIIERWSEKPAYEMLYYLKVAASTDDGLIVQTIKVSKKQFRKTKTGGKFSVRV